MPNYLRANQAGATYFFTVTLENRRSDLLIREIDLLRDCYRIMMQRHPIKTIAICILPDHLHAIWTLPKGDADFSKRWQILKSSFSHALPKASQLSHSKIKHREKGIWQRRFWEHLIRDEDDLQRHIAYIHFNPVKHGLVKSVNDWPHSSFHRYVAAGLLDIHWAGDETSEERWRQDNLD